jgi:hypothetical protein
MPGTNPWLNHIAQYRQANPDVKYKQALIEAKATYSTNKPPVVEAVKPQKKQVEKVVAVPVVAPVPVVEAVKPQKKKAVLPVPVVAPVPVKKVKSSQTAPLSQ